MSNPMTPEALERQKKALRGAVALTSFVRARWGECLDEIDRLRAERDKLQAFKDWVHAYLDTHGVPHHPPGSHGAAGCRIGDRMDWLVAKLERLQAENARNLNLPAVVWSDPATPFTGEQVRELLEENERLRRDLAQQTAYADTAVTVDDARRAEIALIRNRLFSYHLWRLANGRRLDLVGKAVSTLLTTAEAEELSFLETYCDDYLCRLNPEPRP